MLTLLAPNLWHTTHSFTSMGMPLSSRMTVVRCADGGLWLHSPVPITDALKQVLEQLGPVRWIVAPNRSHHLFAKQALLAFPNAQLFGAPGLRAKRPDLTSLQELSESAPSPWQADLDQVFFRGIPLISETVFFHAASGTVVITDLCMWFTKSWPWQTRLYGHLNGTMNRLAVPRLVRLLIRDKAAAALSCQKILQWPIQRVVVAHDCVLETDAQQQLAHALACFSKP